MTQLEQRIITTQRRLWVNRWLSGAPWFLSGAMAVFAMIVLVQRLWNVPIPMIWIGGGLVLSAFVGALLWTMVTRESAGIAAATLDLAAGLRERVSSGRYCLTDEDPFARAVVADAERICANLSPSQHVRLAIPRSWALTTFCLLLAAGMFLVPPGLLHRAEANSDSATSPVVQQTQVAVKKKFDALRKMTENTPALKDIAADLERQDKEQSELHRPEDIRHEALKKIDHLADAVKQKQSGDDYQALRAIKKEFRGLKVPESVDTPAQKLTQALAKSDFKTAVEEIKAMKEQLATLKSEEDKATADKLSQQLDNLAKQLEQLARNENLAQKLQQAGIKKEDVDRMLENLKKEDLEQLAKQMQEKGFSQQQIQQLAQQLQQQQQAGGAADKLAKALQQGAKGNNPSQTGEAMAGLSQAADQLSQLEQLEQEMSQMESTMQALNDARNDLDKPCSGCNGTGEKGGKSCSQCQGSGSEGKGEGGRKGSGMGEKIGEGRGGIAPEEVNDVDFKVEREKVHTGKGAIIGQFLVDGEQVKGEAARKVVELVTAAEHDASDRISRDRVPRQYQKAVKEYFATVRRAIQGDREKATDREESGQENRTEEVSKENPAEESKTP